MWRSENTHIRNNSDTKHCRILWVSIWSHCDAYLRYCVCVRTHLCACVYVSVSACLCISVYPSGLFFLQIKAFVVSTRWRGRDSQLAHKKLIRPVSVFVCMRVCQSMLMFYRRSHYSFHWLMVAHKKTQKTGKCVIYDEVKAIRLMAVCRHF